MDFSAIRIELVAALIALCLLAFGLLVPRGRREITGYIAAVAFLGLLALSFLASGTGDSFQGGRYLNDPLARFFKQLFITAAFLVSLMSLRFTKSLEESRSEFFALLGFALVGMMMLASANDFVTLYIGLELMTLPLVILTAYDRTSGKSTEAGTKYVLLSAISSGVLLFGLSLIFGATGSLAYRDALPVLSSASGDPLVVIGSIMIVAGFAFKISAVPFHMWSPDIYEGAPSTRRGFSRRRLEGGRFFAALIRLLLFVLPASGGAFPLLIVAVSRALHGGRQSHRHPADEHETAPRTLFEHRARGLLPPRPGRGIARRHRCHVVLYGPLPVCQCGHLRRHFLFRRGRRRGRDIPVQGHVGSVLPSWPPASSYVCFPSRAYRLRRASWVSSTCSPSGGRASYGLLWHSS